MNAQGLFSIGGIASGLDTEDIITQLLQLERQPMKQIERRQDDLREVDDAWGELNTKLSSLRTATDAIGRLDRFDDMVQVSSSNEDAVSVTRTGTTDTGSQSFTVTQLAMSKQVHNADSFASGDAALDGRELSITVGDTTHDLTAELGADATLDDLVQAVNDADIGVRASALQVASGDHQLVLDAEATGSEGTFDVDLAASTGWDDGFATTQDAQDAQLTVGGITVTRSSNTIDDLVDGATVTLHRETTRPVTVTAERDIDGAVGAVEDYVDAINNTLKLIAEQTAYDPETKESGPLQGQQAASSLAMSLRTAVSTPIDGLEGTAGLAGSVGIGTTRDGLLTFDEAVARQAFTDDFDGTARTLARSGSTTDAAATYLNGASRTTPGTYEVDVTQAAEVARVTGASYTPPDGDPKIFRIARPGREPVKVTIDEGMSAANAVARINAALRDAGADTITASETADGQLRLAEERYGSAYEFTVEELDANGDVVDGGTVFGLEGTHVGVDVAGTIDGQLASGTGRTLSGTTGGADGLSVRVDGLPAAFEVTFSRGLAGQVGDQLARAEGSGGTVARARASIDSQIDIYQTRLDGFERRLEMREATIRRQFVGMEAMLGRLNSQGEWLNQQLAGLSAQTKT